MLHYSAKAFTGPGAEQRATKFGHFIKAICGSEKSVEFFIQNGIPLEKATNESGNTLGGFLVPQDLDAEIIAIRALVGAFRQGCDKRTAKSDNKIHPRRLGGLTANFVSEGSSIPESSFQLDAVETTQKKAAILGRLSAELDSDALSLGQFVATEIAYAFAALEDDCGFNGDGTSAYRGIAGLANKLVGMKSAVAAAAGHNTYLAIDNTDIANTMAGVMETAIPGAAWYISALGFAQCFCRLAAVSGGLTATMLPDGSIRASFLGFPVRSSAKLPNSTSSLAGKGMLYFGNLAMSSLMAERHAQTVIATSYDRYLDQDQVLIRAVRRLDIVNHTVGDSNSVGPMAMLVGTA